MRLKKMTVLILSLIICVGLATAASAKASSLDSWKPDFDPSGAKYRCIVSNVSHPVIKGVYAGFAIRDELWKRTGGQIYLDFKPFSMLGGEVEVLSSLVDKVWRAPLQGAAVVIEAAVEGLEGQHPARLDPVVAPVHDPVLGQ